VRVINDDRRGVVSQPRCGRVENESIGRIPRAQLGRLEVGAAAKATEEGLKIGIAVVGHLRNLRPCPAMASASGIRPLRRRAREGNGSGAAQWAPQDELVRFLHARAGLNRDHVALGAGGEHPASGARQ